MKPWLIRRWSQGYRLAGKVRVAVNGLRDAASMDPSVAYKIVVAGFVISGCVLYRQWIDILLVISTTAMMLAAELFNSAIEALCDVVQPAQDERIRVVKDVAAAATAVVIVAWVVVVTAEASALLRPR
jgi:diacylglycerol kinase